jgi:HK97 family phage prohead protease
MNGNLAIKIEDGQIAFDDALFEVKKAADTFDDQGQQKRIVTGYAAVADVVDSQYELIAREALEAASKDLLKYTTVLYNHDPDRPIGKVLEARPEGTGLFVKVQISNSENEIWDKICEGIISKFSFRGVITEYDEQFDKSLARNITIIKGFKIFEISLVSVPANPEAKTLNYYLSKALEDRVELHREDPGKVDTDTTVPQPGGSDNSKTGGSEDMPKMDPEDEQRLNAITSMCDKLLAALQDMPNVDARVVGLVKKIKEMVDAFGKAEAAEDAAGKPAAGYPQPAADALDLEGFDPVSEKLKSRMQSVEDKYAALEKKLEDLPAALEEKLTEIVKNLSEQSISEKFGDLEKKLESQAEVISGFAELFELLRPTLGLPAVEKPAEDLTKEGGES